jgi:hypothetical protein
LPFNLTPVLSDVPVLTGRTVSQSVQTSQEVVGTVVSGRSGMAGAGSEARCSKGSDGRRHAAWTDDL